MVQSLRAIAREICPPVLWRVLSGARSHLIPHQRRAQEEGQDLDLYWDKEMAEILESWGEGTTWNEIQLLMAARQGKTLDIACGTGKTMALLANKTTLETYGCDISDMLIGKAKERGIAPEVLTVCDATRMPYGDNEFDFSYSIGSFEHFTIEGIGKVIAEAARVTRNASFHMMPTSRSGRDEGWLKTYQSFHNCSVDWWVRHFEKSFGTVHVLDSKWEDRISVGKWFICSRR